MRFGSLLLAGETALALALARAATALPFRWLMIDQEALGALPAAVDRVSQDARARAVGRMIARVERRLPWKSNCLVEALAARAMLRRRRIASVLHFGVTRSEGRLTAHAWLEAGEGCVCGGREAAGFTHLAGFTAKTPN